MPNPVVLGSLIKCSKGIAPVPLTVLPVNRVFAQGPPIATVRDRIPFVNILPFGMCNSATNPAVIAARAAALGAQVPGPCVPLVTGDWSPGSRKAKVGGAKVLTKNSTCKCAWQGDISVVSTSAVRIQV